MEHALAGAGLVRDVAWGLACPVHRGSSVLPFFGLGLLFQFILAVALVGAFLPVDFLQLPSLLILSPCSVS